MKGFKKFIYFSFIFSILGTLIVHLFDAEFAGKFRGENNDEIIFQGKELYVKKGCHSCHGTNGNNPSDENYPLLGGQPRKYLEQQILDIRDGRRANGSSSIMASSIKRLKDNEAYMISFYLSLR